jgi:hypothetical protein
MREDDRQSGVMFGADMEEMGAKPVDPRAELGKALITAAAVGDPLLENSTSSLHGHNAI